MHAMTMATVVYPNAGADPPLNGSIRRRMLMVVMVHVDIRPIQQFFHLPLFPLIELARQYHITVG